MPEQGDVDKPKLVLFIDEAHLIFKDASQPLFEQFELTVKLIRSKGVGLFFVTQSPNDILSGILGQLGTKIQHALRAFTARDRKAIKSASENYPFSDFYKVDELITQLGIGEAVVSGLDEEGRPTELVHTLIRPPFSRMDILDGAEIDTILKKSGLITKYNVDVDRQSAYEILLEKMDVLEAHKEAARKEEEREATTRKKRTTKTGNSGTFEKILKAPITKMIVQEITRGLLGALGLKSSPRRSSTRRRS